MRWAGWSLVLGLLASCAGPARGPASWERLRSEAEGLGKPEWRPMLRYLAALHERGTHPPRPPFPYPWEEIGTGYVYGPAFGHIDLTHLILDVLPSEPEHARHQLLNNLAAQQEDGLVPGVISLKGKDPVWKSNKGHPPLWVVAADDYYRLSGSRPDLETFLRAALRQISWFETRRRADGTGFYYLDILERTWESGVDEGVRYQGVPPGKPACVDATAHVYLLYEHAARWAAELGRDARPLVESADTLRRFIQQDLYDPETGFFYDAWSVGDPARRVRTFEGLWPVIVGAASVEQARRVIDGQLLDRGAFLTDHPIATVGVLDPRFQLRMWRGPAWNCVTYWAARGCLRYGRPEAAALLLEKALDDTALQYERTGTLWEFYHPFGGPPEELERKPQTEFNRPCRDYVGHNPLFAMARLHARAKRS